VEDDDNKDTQAAPEKWFWLRPGPRCWAHMYLHPAEPDFELVKKVLGKGGANTIKINDATGAKLRVRGRGSGHIEVDGREAPVHLMLAITTVKDDRDGFMKAVMMAIELLLFVSLQYQLFCWQQGLPAPHYHRHSFGEEVAPCCQKMMKDLRAKWPHPDGPKSSFFLAWQPATRSSMAVPVAQDPPPALQAQEGGALGSIGSLPTCSPRPGQRHP